MRAPRGVVTAGFVVSAGCAFGCAAATATTANVVALTAGLPTAVVTNKHKGSAVLTAGASGHVGRADAPATTPGVPAATEDAYGASLVAAGLGIASEGGLGWASRARLELGTFGDDHFFGDIALEVGPGYLRAGRVGGGLTAGWSYGGFYDGKHAIPVRALLYVDTEAALVTVTAHRSWRDQAWEAWGAEAMLMLPTLRNATIGARFEHQDDASLVSLTVGWTLHSVGVPRAPVAARPAPPAPAATPPASPLDPGPPLDPVSPLAPGP